MKISGLHLVPMALLPGLVASIHTPVGLYSNCTSLSPAPIPADELLSYFPPRPVHDFAAVENIRRTLATYAFAIDGKNWNALEYVFTKDAVANYSEPIGLLSGLEAIQTTLPPGLATFVGTQHHLGTQVIDVCSPDTAISVTYYRAAHFLSTTGAPTSVTDDDQVLTAWGQYQDTWKKQEDQSWKIVYRNVIYMDGFVSEMDLT
ncbi:hypothetical protein SLS56_009700 [Neofusicoccum ribis]|uniref:SnoaL-like domain-containing protein n=1 Tax=Neofusicoccum ribis TaxID=45134 RepID=A0ABR3SGG4_9PEZI